METSTTPGLGRQNQCTCSNRTEHHQLNTNHWEYAVDRIKQEMFASTSVALPSPHDYLAEYEGGQRSTFCDYCKLHGANFAFNSDPFSSRDAYSYRRERSEHILFRLTRCLGHTSLNVLQLDQGVFVVQPPPPQQQPLIQQQYTTAKDILTFNYDAMPELISNSNNLIQTTTYIPYSYTLGVRYTKPGANDMMIRGAIPLWCQTLLLHEFYKAKSPIKPGDSLSGLIPFASHLTLTFGSVCDKNDKVDDPELLLWYERFAMDTSDHEFYGQKLDPASPEWQMTRLDILEKAVLCDVTPEDAYVITTLGSVWARTQGFFIE